LEAVRESLTLKYPSYILALAMGAGKTVLIGSIIATEFAMSLEYPDANFVKNALVFAPGKTILGALKEISDMPYEKILPDRLYKQFITTVKFTYTRDGEKDIPIIKGSSFNVIITNTEKIRIQKHTITQTLIKDFLENPSKIDEIKQEVANLRLQTIASLPNLAIFSDEAHHTYGQPLDKRLKRVRQTVDYLAENTNVFVVVNTTGTPYYKKQILKDVVYCYSLSQGIKDGILKEVRDNIVGYLDIADDEFITDVVTDFFKNYKEVKIYDSSPAKLAIYFPQIEDLTNAKSIVEKTLMDRGLDPSIVLEVHNKSAEETKDLFDNRINDPHLPYRVFSS
jgi:Type III restriction enzyme, res subunit.